MSWSDLLRAVGVPEAALLLAIGALVFRTERKWRRMANRLLGDGERPSALDRLDQIERVVSCVQAKLEPDHGASLHDTIIRVDERTVRIERRLDEHLSSPHPKR